MVAAAAMVTAQPADNGGDAGRAGGRWSRLDRDRPDDTDADDSGSSSRSWWGGWGRGGKGSRAKAEEKRTKKKGNNDDDGGCWLRKRFDVSWGPRCNKSNTKSNTKSSNNNNSSSNNNSGGRCCSSITGDRCCSNTKKRNQQPAAAPQQRKRDPNKPCAGYVADLTYPDGTRVLPNTTIEKKWRLRNTGGKQWPLGTSIVFVGGDTLTSLEVVPLEGEMPGPGEELDVTVPFHSPSDQGRFSCFWRLATPDGVRFGARVWIDIMVDPTLSADESASDTGGH